MAGQREPAREKRERRLVPVAEAAFVRARSPATPLRHFTDVRSQPHLRAGADTCAPLANARAGRWSDCNTQWRTNAQRQGSPMLRASPDASQVREAVTPDTPALSSSGSPSFVPKTLSNRCPLITQKMEF